LTTSLLQQEEPVRGVVVVIETVAAAVPKVVALCPKMPIAFSHPSASAYSRAIGSTKWSTCVSRSLAQTSYSILMALVGRCYQVDAAAVGATCDLSLSLQANRRLLADNDRQASRRFCRLLARGLFLHSSSLFFTLCNWLSPIRPPSPMTTTALPRHISSS